MNQLIASGEANNRTHAVKTIHRQDGRFCGASEAADIKRLSGLYAKTYGE